MSTPLVVFLWIVAGCIGSFLFFYFEFVNGKKRYTLGDLLCNCFLALFGPVILLMMLGCWLNDKSGKTIIDFRDNKD